MSQKAVVVGGSLAGLRAAEALRRHGHEGPLAIVGSETHLPYDRPPLSKQVLTGKAAPDATALHVEDGFEAEWRLGTTATGLDLDRRRVALSDGDKLPFDLLVIATGAQPRILPMAAPGPGVHYLRTLDDSLALRAELLGAGKAVVIGAGFIGLEVAASATEMGVQVTVLEALPVPLERAIGARMGEMLAGWHRRHGVDVRLGVGVEAVAGSHRAEGVRLNDGSVVEADLIVVGVGVAPSTGWLEGSGVELDNGVRCDSKLRVRVGDQVRADVVAAGDIARWDHPTQGGPVRIEHWTNAAEQGEAAGAALMLGDAAPDYGPTPYFWSDQHGVKIQFVGEVRPEDELEIVEDEPDDNRLVVTYGRDGRLLAALGMRRPAKVMGMQRMISEGAAFPVPA